MRRSVLPLVALAGACGLVTMLLVASTAPVSARQDPVADANQAVAQAQAQVDQVAGAYFAALEQARRLDFQITDLEHRIGDLQQRVTDLKAIANARAVAAYKRTGNSFESVFLDSAGPADAARRIKLLELLNGRDDEAVGVLRSSQDDLSRQHRELKTARQDQSDTLARLKDQDQQVNAKLVAAQTQRQAAIDAQVQAQQAAAQAAATPPPSAPPSSAPPPPAPPAKNATPTPVPANYAPTDGANPHHDDPYLTCVRHYESSGNYQAYNPGGPAYGAYQFLQSTWNLAANHSGRGDLVGLDPRRASVYDQDQMAWDLYQWQGKGPWSADPC